MSSIGLFTHPITPAGQGVLITGCSSGIGRTTALHLARRGFTVFATVRKPQDAESLRQAGEANLVPVCPLDLTRPEQIGDAREMVARELRARGQTGLYALVNNAGGGSISPIELIDLEKFRTELATRLLGPVALLQAFLPMLREGHGRVVWITTPGLIPTPYVASIHAPDFAANCLARTLEIELRPWKIPNVMVRCGGIQTTSPARSNQELDEALRDGPPEKTGLYSAALRKLQRDFADFDRRRTAPEEVAKVVHRALVSRQPRRSYQVGYMSGAAAFLESLPASLADRLIAARY